MAVPPITTFGQGYSRTPVYFLKIVMGLDTYYFSSRSKYIEVAGVPAYPLLQTDSLSCTGQKINFMDFYTEAAEMTFALNEDTNPATGTGRFLTGLFNAHPYFRGCVCDLYFGFEGMNTSDFICIFEGIIRDISYYKDYIEITSATPVLAIAQKFVPPSTIDGNNQTIFFSIMANQVDMRVTDSSQYHDIMNLLHHHTIAIKLGDLIMHANSVGGGNPNDVNFTKEPNTWTSRYGTTCKALDPGTPIQVGIPFCYIRNAGTPFARTDLTAQNIMSDILIGFGGYTAGEANLTAFNSASSADPKLLGGYLPLFDSRSVLELLQDACQAFGVMPYWRGGKICWAGANGYSSAAVTYSLTIGEIIDGSITVDLKDEDRITRCSVQQDGENTWYDRDECESGNLYDMKGAGPWLLIDDTLESAYGDSREKALTLFFADDPAPVGYAGVNQFNVQQIWIDFFGHDRPEITCDLDFYYISMKVGDKVQIDMTSYGLDNDPAKAYSTYLVVQKTVNKENITIVMRNFCV